MFDYIPDVFKGQYARPRKRPTSWLTDNDSPGVP